MSTTRALGLERVVALGTRRWGSVVAFVVATLVAFFLVAQNASPPFAAHVVAIAVGIAGVALADAIENRGARPRVVALRPVAVASAGLAASLALFGLALAVVARGAVPESFGGVVYTLTFLAAAYAAYRVALALHVIDVDRPLWARAGAWVVFVSAVVYLPRLGVASLWDPWESHYGEVAREILTRHDAISLWWSRDGFFYSKPALTMWIEVLTMAIVGFDPRPDHVLDRGQHPEWILRTPNAILSILALYVVYRVVARLRGRRAGALAALVLGTTPFWVLLAHQSITDMTLVSLMTAAAMLVLLALETPDHVLAPSRVLVVGGTRVTLSFAHVVVAAAVVCALPQILYLASRNLEIVAHGAGAHGLRPHLDAFLAGSPGNCALPGNAPCHEVTPAYPRFQPWMLAAACSALLAAFLTLYAGERRLRRLYFLAAWLLAALAVLAKGPAGLAFPGLVALAHVAVTRRWRDLFTLELVGGGLLLAVVGLPWYVACYLRHGSAFSDELLFHDMLNRAFSHVHDTNEGDDVGLRYYLGQLGYGLFPWSGFALAALFPRPLARRDDPRSRVPAVLSIWAVAAFVLFTLMGTKFHHYIFPAVPALAILAALGLDRCLDVVSAARDRDGADAGYGRRVAALYALTGAAVALLVGRDLAATEPSDFPGAIRLAQLFTYQYHRSWPRTVDLHRALLVAVVVAVVLAALLAVTRTRRLALAAAAMASVLWAGWISDTYMDRVATHWGQGSITRAYYRARSDSHTPLAAFRLNYKGENFYTGNRVAVFVEGGSPFVEWVRKQKSAGEHVLYVVTERPQAGMLRAELPNVHLEEVTSEADSRQFVLYRGVL